jgi:uncharacterized membrane protein YhaH (DUF805 family)
MRQSTNLPGASSMSAEYLPTLLRFLFSFNGRASRADYWLRFGLPVFLADIACGIVDLLLDTNVPETILGLLSLVSFMALGARRLHDRDYPGWLILLSFVPIANLWIILQTWFLAGTDGSNSYGPAP